MSQARDGAPSRCSRAAVPRLCSAIVAAVLLEAGCGGGMPLLHPARVLSPGDVRVMAGFSETVAVGRVASALRAAASEAAGSGTTPNADPVYAAGALVAAAVAPGVAPVAGAAVGIQGEFEGDLAYTGRAVRAAMRRSVDLDAHWSLGFEAGASGVFAGRQDGTASLRGVDLAGLRGWGADVPVIVGYESDGGLYTLWLGARGGFEHVSIGPLGTEAPAPTNGLSASRAWAGGLLGLAVGFRHVHVAAELDASYAALTGHFGQAHASVAGATIAPAAALWWRF